MGADDVRRVAEALASARSIVVASHVDPDGDAIGSTLALWHALQTTGATVLPVLARGTTPPATYAFLPGSSAYRQAGAVPPPDVFIALDTPNLARLGEAAELARAASFLVFIDHHPDGDDVGHVRIIDTAAAAVGEMLFDIIPALGLSVDKAVATCLFTAVMTDTGRFSYGNTSPRSLEIAADLVRHGADPSAIFRAVYESRSPGALRLIGRTLSRITLAAGGAIAYSWVTDDDLAETGALPEETENLVDQVRALGGADIVFLVKESAEGQRVSLRAKGAADVGSVARRFGGGGHAAAAGFTFSGDRAALLDVLVPALAEVLP
ncbi:MAG: DHH family phosphoesterase [Anaerosomatales bacterium]|nr:DHH family phosphoesterase [Anaerosomatales bacterium]